jgi:hypothetical protein
MEKFILFKTAQGISGQTIADYKKSPSTFNVPYSNLNALFKGNMFALQHKLGHSNISMTKRYLKLAESDLVEQHSIALSVQNFIKRTTRVKKLFK